MKQSVLGLYFEDFIVGDEIKHSLSKTIFECDNNFFSLMTMNHHPVHTNIDYAGKNQHGKILVVGTLVFSLAVGITVPDVSGKAIANLGEIVFFPEITLLTCAGDTPVCAAKSTCVIPRSSKTSASVSPG